MRRSPQATNTTSATTTTTTAASPEPQCSDPRQGINKVIVIKSQASVKFEILEFIDYFKILIYLFLFFHRGCFY